MDNTEEVRLQTSRSRNRTSEREFDGLLIESLDESLAILMGEIAKWAVYDGIGRKYGIPRSNITERLSEFTLALEGIFGVTASTTMTRLVIKRLYSKLGLTFVERPGWRLPDYVTEGRNKMAMFRESIERPSACESPLKN